MNKLNYAALALIPLLGAAGIARAAEFAHGLSVGTKQGAIQQAQADMRRSAPQEPMDGKLQPTPSAGPATAESRMSEQGKLNTNGPNSLDRDKGTARAEDRSSAQAKTHTRNAKKKKTDLD